MTTNFKDRVYSLHTDMSNAYDLYLQARKEFGAFEGKMIDDSNIAKINESIAKVQDTFNPLLDVFKFIDYNATFAKNALENHQSFIDLLKKIGAQETPAEHTHGDGWINPTSGNPTRGDPKEEN